MTQEMMIMAAILVAVILLTFIGILSRYRKCKSDEVLVVYGKTGGDKKSAKLYHGGAAFVWPIIQGYEFLSMKPMQIECKLTGALSAQNIRVDVPTTISPPISSKISSFKFIPIIVSKTKTRMSIFTKRTRYKFSCIYTMLYIFNTNSSIGTKNSYLTNFRENIIFS